MIISVIVPTYRRIESLRECIQGLEFQHRKADEVIIVVRSSDMETQDFLSCLHTQLPMKMVFVVEGGVVSAMNSGKAAARGDIICLTDDDSVPRPDWLQRLERHYESDDKIGMVGGKDIIHQNGETLTGSKSVVGKLQWFGRAIGNHHIGIGPCRDVDFLKGVNYSFRTIAAQGIGFDRRLKGEGAQVHWEMAHCLKLKKRGWRIIYDPEVVVDHYPAPRHDIDGRGAYNAESTLNRSFNETLVVVEHIGFIRALAFLGWALIAGNQDSPGFINAIRRWVKGDRHSWSRLTNAVKGRAQGLMFIAFRGSEQHGAFL